MTDLSLDLRKKLDESAQLPVLNIKKKPITTEYNSECESHILSATNGSIVSY